MMWHWLITLLICRIDAIDINEGVCTTDDCDEGDVDWEDEGFIDQFRSWLNTEKSKSRIVFCKDEAEKKALSEKTTPLYRFERCDFLGYHVKYNYQGKRDGQSNKFKGRGVLTFLPQEFSSNYQRGNNGNLKLTDASKEDGFCIIDNAFMSLQSITGNFKDGLPNGEISIKHNNFVETKGQAKAGVLHGKVVMRNSNFFPTFIGRYKDGVPHGWAWILPPDGEDLSSGAVYVRFKYGMLEPSKAVFLDIVSGKAWIGNFIIKGTKNILVSATELKKIQYADIGCLKRLNLPEVDTKSQTKLELPVRIKMSGGRLSIVSSNLLMFNRVAKVGSQSLIKLLFKLNTNNKYDVHVDVRTEEEYNVPPWEQFQMAETLSSKAKPMVWVRHFNFLDFDSLGLASPTWINIVRDPVERVISNFYYRRAGWNIVERKLAFPNEPLPDPQFLRRDFETCVLEGDPECSYIENSIDTVWETGDHRRQMMQFCGQSSVCAKFNNPEAMKLAKENVSKYYSVVGITELWNETLEVLEHNLPFFFKGARDMYANKFKEVRRMSQNFHKGFVSEEIKNIVRANFSREIEFYEFCKERLRLQLSEIRGNQLT